MAEADRDPTTRPFAIPPPVRITLSEAVDLIAGKGLDPDAVWNALSVALSDGRLSAGDCRPEYFRNLPYEQLALRGMPEADLDAIRWFSDIPPGSWRCWIDEDGPIIRATGEVIRHFPGGHGVIHFQPTLSRIDVLSYFMAAIAPEARPRVHAQITVAPKVIAPEVETPAEPPGVEDWAPDALRRMKADGVIHNSMSAAHISKLLAAKSQDDARVGKLAKQVSDSHIRNHFRKWGLDKISAE